VHYVEGSGKVGIELATRIFVFKNGSYIQGWKMNLLSVNEITKVNIWSTLSLVDSTIACYMLGPPPNLCFMAIYFCGFLQQAGFPPFTIPFMQGILYILLLSLTMLDQILIVEDCRR